MNSKLFNKLNVSHAIQTHVSRMKEFYRIIITFMFIFVDNYEIEKQFVGCILVVEYL